VRLLITPKPELEVEESPPDLLEFDAVDN